MKSKLLLILLPFVVASCSLLNMNQTDVKIIKSTKTLRYKHHQYSRNGEITTINVLLDSLLVVFNLDGQPIKSMNTRGNNNFVKTIEYVYDNNNKVGEHTTDHYGADVENKSWQYDSDNKLITHKRFNKDRILTDKFDIIYDSKDRAVSRTSYTKGKGYSTKKMIYNNKGKKIKESILPNAYNSSLIYTYEYDNSGNIIHYTSVDTAFNKSSEVYKTYSSEGILIKDYMTIDTKYGLNKSACFYDESGKTTDREYYELNGALKSSTRISYDDYGNMTSMLSEYPDKEKLTGQRYEYFYNNNGDILSKTSINCGNLETSEKYIYNERGNNIEFKQFDSQNRQTIQVIATYNKKGYKIKETKNTIAVVNNYHYEYFYASDSILVKQNSYQSNELYEYYKYSYDLSRNEIEVNIYTADSLLIHSTKRRFNKDQQIDWEKEYDLSTGETKFKTYNKGKLLEIKILNENSTISKINYSYDEFGNVVEMLRWKRDYSIDPYIVYSYHPSGNENERIEYNADGVEIFRSSKTYDQGNLLIQEELRNSLTGNLVWSIDYEAKKKIEQKNFDASDNLESIDTTKYDDSGNIIEYAIALKSQNTSHHNSWLRSLSETNHHHTYNMDEALTHSKEITTYDSNHNWISKEIYDNDILTEKTVREIEYY